MKQVYLMWHHRDPVGICVFCTPALSLNLRNRFFGLSGKRTKLGARALNRQLLTLSRVVIDPKYRGAGLASLFVRRCCELTGWPWIEALAAMGQMNPFFERAGFLRVGTIINQKSDRKGHSGIYGGQRLLSRQSHAKSEHAQPIYFLLDNRDHAMTTNPTNKPQ